MGHPAYDVASLLQDARVTVPADLELKLIGLYARERRGRRPRLRRGGLRASLRDHGRAARHQVLGIFARLDKRDGKPRYLGTCRASKPISPATCPPGAAKLRAWYENYLPRLAAGPMPFPEPEVAAP